MNKNKYGLKLNAEYETWSLAPKEEYGLRAEFDLMGLGQCVV